MAQTTSAAKPSQTARTKPSRKVKLSVTLDSQPVRDLRRRVGARGLSAVVNRAVRVELDRLRRDEALDRWLDELEGEDGPIASETLDHWEKIWQDQSGAA